MKLDPADIAFSWWIRCRDNWTCVRCGTPYEPPTRALQCSHYFGRTKQSVRFDPENCDTLCHGCHRIWEKEDREGYRSFKVIQLGEAGYDWLTIRANTPGKKDYKLQALVWKQKLKEDFPQYYQLLYNRKMLK